MVESNLTIIVIFVLYLVMMLAIGLMAYKKTSNTEDYFLGGRKLGSWVVSLSAQASDMSGWMLMGLPGAAYIAGLEAGWIALGLTIGTYLNWKLVAKRLRNYTEACNAITIPQFLGNRYRDDQNILRIVSSLFILIFFLVYTASAFVSGGKLFSTVFGIDYTLALLICAIVVVSYTFAGGFFAVCWTDLVQGILMFVAIVIVPCAAVVSMGGIDATIARIEAVNINMLNPFITLDGTHIAAITVISSLAWGLGYFGQPHILVRFMGIDDAKSIKKSRLIAMVWVVFSLTASTMAFATLCLARLFHGFNCRGKGSIFKLGVFSNKYVWYAFAIGLVLLNAVLFIPGLQMLFEVESLMVSQYITIYVLAFIPTLIIQFTKVIEEVIKNKKSKSEVSDTRLKNIA